MILEGNLEKIKKIQHKYPVKFQDYVAFIIRHGKLNILKWLDEVGEIDLDQGCVEKAFLCGEEEIFTWCHKEIK